MSKKNALTIGLICLMCLLLCFPNLCLNAAQTGLLLWFNKVLPSLLPFMIFINLLVPLDGLSAFTMRCTALSRKIWHLPGESFFAFFMGLIAGYPMGAKVVKTLYTNHQLTRSEAERTLCFCNNCGPLFIIGTVGTAMLSQTQLGYFLFGIHILSAFLMSFFITRSTPVYTTPHLTKTTSKTSPPLFTLLNLAVMNTMDTLTCIGGYIILFSVLLTLLTQTPLTLHLLNLFSLSPDTKQLISGLLGGLLELSNGAHALSKLPLSLYSIALISGFIGFGGICVYFQSLFVLGDVSLNTKPFFLSKCFQGLLSFSLTLLIYPIYNRLFPSSTTLTSSIFPYTSIYWVSCSVPLIISLSGALLLFHTHSTYDLPLSKSSKSA